MDPNNNNNNNSNSNTDTSGNSMWLDKSIHVPSDPLAAMTNNNNNNNNSTGSARNSANNDARDSGGNFAAPAPFFSQGANNGSAASNRRRLPSLALCDISGGGADFNSSQGGASQSRPSSARASVAGAHSQQLFALQEQLTLSKASADDHKQELAQLQDRLELEQKATKRWQDKAQKEEEKRVAAERKVSDAQFGEVAQLREQLQDMDQQLRTERRNAQAEKTEALRVQQEQFAEQQKQQEQWWKEEVEANGARVANLEQAATASANLKRELEVAQRNETDLRGHVSSLQEALVRQEEDFEAQLKQQAANFRDDNSRALAQAQEDFAMRSEKLRARVSELETEARAVDTLRRELQAAQDLAQQREADVAVARRTAASERARLESELEQRETDMQNDHRAQLDALAAEHSEELAKMRSRIAAASTLSERCARLETMVSDWQSTSRKHEAELQAVLEQLAASERSAISIRQECDDLHRRAATAEQQMRSAEEDFVARIDNVRSQAEQQCRALQQTIDEQNNEMKEVQDEYEANLEQMITKLTEQESRFAQAESAWQKERLQLRQAENEARRAAFETGDANQAQMQDLVQKLEEANGFAQAQSRRAEQALSELNALRSEAAANQAAQSKAEVDLAAARSTVRALETRLEVVRAGSVAASMSSAMNTSSGANNNSSLFAAPPTSLSNGGFSAVPSFRNSFQQQQQQRPSFTANQVVEVGEASSNGNDDDSNNNNNKKSNSQPPRNTTAAAGLRSALVSRSPSSQNSRANNNNNNTSDIDSKTAALRLPTSNGNGNAQRRARTNDDEAGIAATRVVEDGKPRVFAFTGFDPSEVQRLSREVEQLGGTVVECKANSVPPAVCTHLVSNGLMTVKLLASLARGMWVVPSSFVHQCVASRGFVDEAANGGKRHENAPFFSTTAVAFTPAFKSSRHAQTATTVVNEGGATLVENNAGDVKSLLEGAGAWPKLGRNLRQRMLVCTTQELSEVEDEMQGKKFALDVVTWESVLKRLYPETIAA